MIRAHDGIAGQERSFEETWKVLSSRNPVSAMTTTAWDVRERARRCSIGHLSMLELDRKVARIGNDLLELISSRSNAHL